jgi:hypothetical protein
MLSTLGCRITNRFEVRIRTTREWERAFLHSFDISRRLRRPRGGTVSAGPSRLRHRSPQRQRQLAYAPEPTTDG